MDDTPFQPGSSASGSPDNLPPGGELPPGVDEAKGCEADDELEFPEELQPESFDELAKFTVGGFLVGLAVAAVLDTLGLHRSGLGQAVVRTLAGEGESIFEGAFAVRRRLQGKAGSMAEAYGWGKLFGMALPWLVDLGSRLAGVDVYAVEGFYIAWFYSMSDQVGANLLGLSFLRHQEASWKATWMRYFTHPVMLASLAVILVVPLGLLVARLAGFSPTTQVRTALETIVANLCWVPPVVGWMFQEGSSSSDCSGR